MAFLSLGLLSNEVGAAIENQTIDGPSLVTLANMAPDGALGSTDAFESLGLEPAQAKTMQQHIQKLTLRGKEEKVEVGPGEETTHTALLELIAKLRSSPTIVKKADSSSALVFKACVNIPPGGSFSLPIVVGDKATLSYKFDTEQHDVAFSVLCIPVTTSKGNNDAVEEQPASDIQATEGAVSTTPAPTTPKPAATKSRKGLQWLVQSDRVQGKHHGTLETPGAGKLIFTWDNSYSWVRSKRITYTVEGSGELFIGRHSGDADTWLADLEQLATDVDNFHSSAPVRPGPGGVFMAVQRVVGWAPDVSPAGLRQVQSSLEHLRARALALAGRATSQSPTILPVGALADLVLLRCRLDTWHWHLVLQRAPLRSPVFYLDQTVGAVAQALAVLPRDWDAGQGAGETAKAVSDQVVRAVVTRLDATARILEQGTTTLTNHVVPAFARVAQLQLQQQLSSLAQVCQNLVAAVALTEQGIELKELRDGEKVSPPLSSKLQRSYAGAHAALVAFGEWLQQQQESHNGGDASTDELLERAVSCGPGTFMFYLRRVALLPITPSGALLLLEREADTAEGLWALHQLAGCGDHAADADTTMVTEAVAFAQKSSLVSLPPPSLDGRAAGCEARLSALSPAFGSCPPVLTALGHGFPRFLMQWEVSAEETGRKRLWSADGVEGVAAHLLHSTICAGFAGENGQQAYASLRHMQTLRARVAAEIATGRMGVCEAGGLLAGRAGSLLGKGDAATDDACWLACNVAEALAPVFGLLQTRRLCGDWLQARGTSSSLCAFHDALTQGSHHSLPLPVQRWLLMGKTDHLLRSV